MIKVVTDSVASLPASLAKTEGVEVVSLYLNDRGAEYEDATMDVDGFYARIYDMADNPPTSSQPSQAAFEEFFERAAQAGDEVLGVWISGNMSGTFEGAVRAARAVEARNSGFSWAMVDSTSNSGDEMFPVLAGARAAREGATLTEAARAVAAAVPRTRFLFTPESLTFLQKGGRIGDAAALLGNLIKLSPVLTVIDGTTSVCAKVRTRKRALDKIVFILQKDIEECAGLADLVVHYIGDKTPALEWAHEVIEPMLQRRVKVIPVSPVIGLHLGPAVGIAYECNAPLRGKFSGDTASLVCAN